MVDYYVVPPPAGANPTNIITVKRRNIETTTVKHVDRTTWTDECGKKRRWLCAHVLAALDAEATSQVRD
jgi:hypothetical protein